MRWLHGLGFAALSLTLFCALLLTLAVAASITPGVAQWVWQHSADYHPAGLQIARIDGALIGPLHLQGLRYDDGTQRIQLKTAELRWEPSALLERRLNITALTLDGLDIALAPLNKAEAEPTPSPTFELPLRIELPQLLITSITLQLANETTPRQVDRLELAGFAEGQAFTLQHFDASGPQLKLQAKASGGWQPFQLRLTQLDVSAYDSKLQASGEIDETLSLDWSLHSPDLGQLLPGAQGTIDSEGQLRGNRTAPQLQTQIHASGLAWKDLSLATLALTATIDTQDKGTAQLRLTAAEGRMGDTHLSQATVTLDGSPESHRLSLIAHSSVGNVEWAGQGQWQKQGARWQLQLQRADIQLTGMGVWHLQTPAAIELSATTLDIALSCWQLDKASLCLQADGKPSPQQAKIQLRDLPLTLIKPLLPPDLQLTGTVSADAHWQQPPGAAARATLNAHSSPIAVRVRHAGRQPTLTVAQLSQLTLNTQGNSATTEADLSLKPGGTAHVTANLSDYTNPQSPLQGQLDLDLDDLGVVRRFAPQLQAVQGNITGQIQLSGTRQTPQVHGQINLTGGQFHVESAGLKVRDLHAQMTGQGEQLRLTAEAQSGAGAIQLTAHYDPAQRRAEATLTGKDFLAFDTADARLWLNPNLALTLQDQRADLSGTLHIPRAEITPRKLDTGGAIGVSPDQVLVPGAKPSTLPLFAKIKLTLGDAVRVAGLGLTAAVTGALELTDSPGELTTASGELSLNDGSYTVYGQTLELTRGRLIYVGGPVAEPAFDLRAERQPRKAIRVGVHARGPATAPSISLYSDPDMTDAERLSWLMFGKPLDGNTGGNAALYRAALSLGLNRGTAAADKLGKELGIDSISLDTGEEQDITHAAVVVGKYLTERLYMSYGIGLFDAVRTLRVRYDLSRTWTLQAESGAARGGDILYNIER